MAAQVRAAVDPATGTSAVTNARTDPRRAVKLAALFADELVKYLAEKHDEVLGGRPATTLKRVDELKRDRRRTSTP